MSVRRIVIALSSFALVAVGGLGLAPSASAGVMVCPVLSGPAPHTVTPSAAPGVNWSGCNLVNANLRLAALTGANLTGANLLGANLLGANLTGANLLGANLTGASLDSAFLDSANMTGADLTGADLTYADLTDAFVSCSDTGVLGTGIVLTDVSTFTLLPADWVLSGGTLSVPIVPCPDLNISSTQTPPLMWMQSIGRTTATSTCPEGTNPSWAMWPNGGNGGYTCDWFVPA
jgi:hypothetical protein